MKRQKRDGEVACSSVERLAGWGQSGVSTVLTPWEGKRERGRGREEEKEGVRESTTHPRCPFSVLPASAWARVSDGEERAHLRLVQAAGPRNSSGREIDALWHTGRVSSFRTSAAKGTDKSKEATAGQSQSSQLVTQSRSVSLVVPVCGDGCFPGASLWQEVLCVSAVSVLVHCLMLSCLRRCSLCSTWKTVCAAGWITKELWYQSSRYHTEQRGTQQ